MRISFLGRTTAELIIRVSWRFKCAKFCLTSWAENTTLGYTELPIENSIAVYKAVRAASLDILKRFTMEAVGK